MKAWKIWGIVLVVSGLVCWGAVAGIREIDRSEQEQAKIISAQIQADVDLCHRAHGIAIRRWYDDRVIDCKIIPVEPSTFVLPGQR